MDSEDKFRVMIYKSTLTNSSKIKTRILESNYYGTNSIKFSINRLLMFCLIFAIVFMPSDAMNIKISSFLLLLILNLELIIKYIFKKENSIILFFGIVFPVLLVFVSTIVDDFKIFSSLRIAYNMLYILLIPVIIAYKINYEKILIFFLTILSIFIAMSGLLDLFGFYSLNNNVLLHFFNMNNDANVGLWNTTTFGYVIFFKASPLLIILIGYAMKNRLNILLIVTLIAMAFTGTRANLYASIIVICLYFLICAKKNLIKVMIFIFFIILIALNIGNIMDFIQNASLIKESTDSIKYEHIKSIFIFLSQNPLYIITGSGLGSFFYSTGVMGYTNLVEIAYLDLFRQMGAILFVLFMYFLVKPIKCLYMNKDYTWLVISYLGYLAIAFTNPLLFSSTPFAIYILIYLKYIDCSKSFNLVSEKHEVPK